MWFEAAFPHSAPSARWHLVALCWSNTRGLSFSRGPQRSGRRRGLGWTSGPALGLTPRISTWSHGGGGRVRRWTRRWNNSSNWGENAVSSVIKTKSLRISRGSFLVCFSYKRHNLEMGEACLCSTSCASSGHGATCMEHFSHTQSISQEALVTTVHFCSFRDGDLVIFTRANL